MIILHKTSYQPTATDHTQISSDYRKAGLWSESRGLVAAADKYMSLANLHHAYAVIYASPVPPSAPDLDIAVDLEW